MEAAIINVIAGFSIFSAREESGLSVYPNPVDESLYVTGYPLDETASEILIYNMLGESMRFVLPVINCFQACQLDVSNFPAGIYFLEMMVDEKTQRVMFMKI